MADLSVLYVLDAGDVSGVAGDGFRIDDTEYYGAVKKGCAEGVHADDPGILGFVPQEFGEPLSALR
ncbi:hypothetical protein [Niveibacterium terrae]|uniref:hypothetical protein n=1 Tax=Niveibacterium terrae TaxID=3373598 RepID=UPI003A8FD979